MEQFMSLASDKRVSGLIFQILEFACAGGMSEERREELYNEILDYYSELTFEATESFFEDIVRLFLNYNNKLIKGLYISLYGNNRNN